MQSTSLPPLLVADGRGGPTDPSHDERLRRGIIDTAVQRSVAWFLVAAFCLGIVGVPLAQAYIEHREQEESPLLGLFQRHPTAENLHQLEKDIEEASYAKAYVQPRFQALLTRWGRVGNKRALVGRNGWLYYTPGVLHVGGPGFLEPDVIRGREKDALDAGEPALVADPRPAILSFHAALARRGIRLVLVPIPDKSSIQGEPLHGRDPKAERVENRDFAQFVQGLRARGVSVFDAREALADGPGPWFLEQDTHWTPGFMQRVAARLARHVSASAVLPPLAAPVSLHVAAEPVSRVGDIVDMLKLPEEQTLFLPRTVRIDQVRTSDESAWEPDASADVLLLGDSFCNIFSLESMGWGSASGLAPQLSLALARPVDVIAQNDSGAFATRQALHQQLRAGEDRLRSKRVVIWEFASRELSVGDWKRIDWDSSAKEHE